MRRDNCQNLGRYSIFIVGRRLCFGSCLESASLVDMHELQSLDKLLSKFRPQAPVAIVTTRGQSLSVMGIQFMRVALLKTDKLLLPPSISPLRYRNSIMWLYSTQLRLNCKYHCSRISTAYSPDPTVPTLQFIGRVPKTMRGFDEMNVVNKNLVTCDSHSASSFLTVTFMNSTALNANWMCNIHTKLLIKHSENSVPKIVRLPIQPSTGCYFNPILNPRKGGLFGLQFQPQTIWLKPEYQIFFLLTSHFSPYPDERWHHLRTWSIPLVVESRLLVWPFQPNTMITSSAALLSEGSVLVLLMKPGYAQKAYAALQCYHT